MLVNFKVENYKSYKDKAEFSMETGEGLPVDSSSTLPISYIDPVSKNNIVQDYLLKTAAILGSNFQGKSNLIDALHFFKDAVIFNDYYSISSERLAYDLHKPTTWEVSLTDTYGEIVKYTLVYAPDNITSHKPQKLSIEKNNKCQTYDLDSKMKQSLHKLKNNDDYAMLQKWLIYCIFVSVDCTTRVPLIDNYYIDLKDKPVTDSLESLLSYFGISKDDIKRCLNYTISFEDALNTVLYDDNIWQSLEPSDYTIAYIVRLIATLYSFQSVKNGIIFIDNFDNIISTEFAENLVRLFNSKANNCQIIVTTRSSEVLDFGLRKDQVWFVNRDRHGVSTLYSLFDFDEPSNFDCLQGYRDSRYGGTNYLAPDLVQQGFEALVEVKNAGNLY